MRNDQLTTICRLIEEGQEELINHPSTHEEGRLVRCSGNHLIVETDHGPQEWDGRECFETHLRRDDYRWG